jgi:uncharacterized damage-inducible protein DinB
MKDTVTHLVDYNTWANKRYATWLSSFAEQDLVQKLHASFDTIAGTIGHMIDAQLFWLLFLQGGNYAAYPWYNYKKNVHELIDLFLHSTLQFNECCNNFNEDDLKQKRKFATFWATNELPLGQYIIHTVNHNTYHRGQIVSMAHQLRQINQIPHTEFSFYLAENSN